MSKNSFVFYDSFYKAISKIQDINLKVAIYDAICELGLNDNVIELDDIVGQMIMELIRPQIEASKKNYEQGSRGGRPQTYDRKKIEEYIIKGFSNQEIANKINCSAELVKKIRKELGTNNGNYPVNNIGNNQDIDEGNKVLTNENDNVNVNENDNDNVNVNENDNDNKVVVVVSKEMEILKFCENEFGRSLSDSEKEVLFNYENEINDNRILGLAIKECSLQNKKTVAYFEGILNNWQGKSYEDILKLKEERKEMKKGKEPTEEELKILDYNWLDSEGE